MASLYDRIQLEFEALGVEKLLGSIGNITTALNKVGKAAFDSETPFQGLTEKVELLGADLKNGSIGVEAAKTKFDNLSSTAYKLTQALAKAGDSKWTAQIQKDAIALRHEIEGVGRAIQGMLRGRAGALGLDAGGMTGSLDAQKAQQSILKSMPADYARLYQSVVQLNNSYDAGQSTLGGTVRQLSEMKAQYNTLTSTYYENIAAGKLSGTQRVREEQAIRRVAAAIGELNSLTQGNIGSILAASNSDLTRSQGTKRLLNMQPLVEQTPTYSSVANRKLAQDIEAVNTVMDRGQGTIIALGQQHVALRNQLQATATAYNKSGQASVAAENDIKRLGLAINSQSTALERQYNAFAKAAGITTTYKQFLENLSKGQYAFNAGITKQQEEHNKLNDLIGISIGKLLRYRIATGAIFGTMNQVTGSVKEFIEINKQLAQLAIIIDPVANSLDHVRRTAVELGQQFGITTSEVLKGYNTWARIGLRGADIVEATKATLIGVNALGMSTESVTEALTSVIFTYDKSVAQSVTAMSQWLRVANDFPLSAADIANALKTTGAAAAEVGISLESFPGYVAAINTETRKSGTAIGQSLKTQLARLVKPQTETLLNEVGIAVRATADEYRSMDDVLDELAAKWGNLTSVQRVNIATAVGGIRRYVDFLALMDQYAVKTRSLALSLTATNEAQRASDIVMSSASKQVDKAAASFANLQYAVGAGLAPSLLSILGPLTTLMNFIQSSTVATHLLVGAIKTLTGAAALFVILKGGAYFADVFGTSILALNTKLLGFQKSTIVATEATIPFKSALIETGVYTTSTGAKLQMLAVAETKVATTGVTSAVASKNLWQTLKLLGTGATYAGISVAGLTVALKALGKATVILFVISAITEGISYLISKIGQATEAKQEFNNTDFAISAGTKFTDIGEQYKFFANNLEGQKKFAEALVQTNNNVNLQLGILQKAASGTVEYSNALESLQGTINQTAGYYPQYSVAISKALGEIINNKLVSKTTIGNIAKEFNAQLFSINNSINRAKESSKTASDLAVLKFNEQIPLLEKQTDLYGELKNAIEALPETQKSNIRPERLTAYRQDLEAAKKAQEELDKLGPQRESETAVQLAERGKLKAIILRASFDVTPAEAQIGKLHDDVLSVLTEEADKKQFEAYFDKMFDVDPVTAKSNIGNMLEFLNEKAKNSTKAVEDMRNVLKDIIGLNAKNDQRFFPNEENLARVLTLAKNYRDTLYDLEKMKRTPVINVDELQAAATIATVMGERFDYAKAAADAITNSYKANITALQAINEKIEKQKFDMETVNELSRVAQAQSPSEASKPDSTIGKKVATYKIELEYKKQELEYLNDERDYIIATGNVLKDKLTLAQAYYAASSKTAAIEKDIAASTSLMVDAYKGIGSIYADINKNDEASLDYKQKIFDAEMRIREEKVAQLAPSQQAAEWAAITLEKDKQQVEMLLEKLRLTEEYKNAVQAVANAQEARSSIKSAFESDPVANAQKRVDLTNDIRSAEADLVKARVAGDQFSIASGEYRLEQLRKELKQYTNLFEGLKARFGRIAETLATQFNKRLSDHFIDQILDIQFKGKGIDEMIGNAMENAATGMNTDMKAILDTYEKDVRGIYDSHALRLERALSAHSTSIEQAFSKVQTPSTENNIPAPVISPTSINDLAQSISSAIAALIPKVTPPEVASAAVVPAETKVDVVIPKVPVIGEAANYLQAAENSGKRFVELFSTLNSSQLEVAQSIADVAQQSKNVSVGLAQAVAYTESTFKANAFNAGGGGKGAAGVYQLRGPVSKDYGILGAGFDDRMNKEKNIKTGVNYLDDIFDRISKKYPQMPDKQKQEMAIAAYTQGPTSVINRGEPLTAATQEYVRNVMNSLNRITTNRLSETTIGEDKAFINSQKKKDQSKITTDILSAGSLDSYIAGLAPTINREIPGAPIEMPKNFQNMNSKEADKMLSALLAGYTIQGQIAQSLGSIEKVTMNEDGSIEVLKKIEKNTQSIPVSEKTDKKGFSNTVAALKSTTNLMIAQLGQSIGTELGSKFGGSTKGATTGSSLGELFGPQLVKDLFGSQKGQFGTSFAGGLIGLLGGGILGGIFGGLFGTNDAKPPVDNYTEAIDRNTEALQANTDGLKNLDASVLNAPSTFISPIANSRPTQVNNSFAISVTGGPNPQETARAVARIIESNYNDSINTTATNRRYSL